MCDKTLATSTQNSESHLKLKNSLFIANILPGIFRAVDKTPCKKVKMTPCKVSNIFDREFTNGPKCRKVVVVGEPLSKFVENMLNYGKI